VAENKIFKSLVKIDPKYVAASKAMFDLAKLLEQKDYQGALTTLLIDLNKNPKISASDLHKILFFIQLAQIKDEKGLSSLLNAYAAPIGSSSLKRKSKFNVSVNGYVGLCGGYEYVLNTPGGTNKFNSSYYGVSAPIGLSFTKYEITLFLSVVDLGSLINARIQNDSTNYSNLRLDQFFSPGVGLYYNLPHSPITLGFYGCMINNVRNITYNNASAIVTETNKNVARVNFSLLIDIPFLTLSNTPN